MEPEVSHAPDYLRPQPVCPKHGGGAMWRIRDDEYLCVECFREKRDAPKPLPRDG
jgi:hypothetical protein